MIYLDNASTTKPNSTCILNNYEWMFENYGNPSSSHTFGRRVKKKIDDSRHILAQLINADDDEIFFTSGSTEACNWVGTMFENQPIAVTKTSHMAVINGIHGHMVDVDKNGNIDFHTHMDEAKLFCCEHANNETGMIIDVEKVSKHCKEHNQYLFIDATQSFCKIPIDVKKMGIDMLCFSAHKFGGLKGVGVLYICKDVQKKYGIPFIRGGKQEDGMRAGTENTFAIITMADVAKIKHEGMETDNRFALFLKDYFVDKISTIPNAHVNIDTDFPYIVSVRFDGVNANDLMTILDMEEIYVSTGSACCSGLNKPSYVLTALGFSEEEANSTIRFSFGLHTTGELDEVVTQIKKAIDMLCEG